jgi:hypothetical protein
MATSDLKNRLQAAGFRLQQEIKAFCLVIRLSGYPVKSLNISLSVYCLLSTSFKS